MATGKKTWCGSMENAYRSRSGSTVIHRELRLDLIGGKPLCRELATVPESKDHVNINEQYELFINGKWQKPKSGTRSTGSGSRTPTPSTHHRAEARTHCRGQRGRRGRRREGRPLSLRRAVGKNAGQRPSTSTAWRACCNRKPASSPWSKAWMAVRPFNSSKWADVTKVLLPTVA